jgi:hypothetical protein
MTDDGLSWRVVPYSTDERDDYPVCADAIVDYTVIVSLGEAALACT